MSIHVRGEGGAVWEMDLPLSPHHQKALEDGAMVRVNADGTDWTETPGVPRKRRTGASRAAGGAADA